MSSPSAVRLGANVAIEVRSVADGALVRRQERHNLVTAAGLDRVRDLLYGDAAGTPRYFALGTGDRAPAAGDLALGAEVLREAVLERSKQEGSLVLSYYLGSGVAVGETIAEAGLFDAVAGGLLFARVVFEPIVKTEAITVTFGWALELSAA